MDAHAHCNFVRVVGKMRSLEEADKVVHPVHTQWHYPILIAAGFVPETQEATGFVRRYRYKRDNGHCINVSTGASADYWDDATTSAHGYWSTLGPHIAKL